MIERNLALCGFQYDIYNMAFTSRASVQQRNKRPSSVWETDMQSPRYDFALVYRTLWGFWL